MPSLFLPTFHIWIHVTPGRLHFLPHYMQFSCYHYYCYYFSRAFSCTVTCCARTSKDPDSHEDPQAASYQTRRYIRGKNPRAKKKEVKLIFNLYLSRAKSAWKHFLHVFFFLFHTNDHGTDPLATVFLKCHNNVHVHAYLLSARLQRQGIFMQFI